MIAPVLVRFIASICSSGTMALISVVNRLASIAAPLIGFFRS